MVRRTPARPGFTLLELLIVATIIAILISMILPALQSSREASRRSGCINNLRQLILATHTYESTYLVLPPGVVDTAGPIRNRVEGLHIGWIVQLLPAMEQRSLHDSIETESSVYDPINLKASSTWLKTVKCPTDPNDEKGPRGMSSYAGCHHDVEAPIDVNNHGVFFLNSRINRDDITDGTSFTIFFGEKRLEDDDLGWLSGTRATLRNTGTAINKTAKLRGDLVGGFGSYHPGGCNFAFGDGRVKFVSERIDPGVYRRLGHRSDGDLISGDAF